MAINNTVLNSVVDKLIEHPRHWRRERGPSGDRLFHLVRSRLRRMPGVTAEDLTREALVAVVGARVTAKGPEMKAREEARRAEARAALEPVVEEPVAEEPQIEPGDLQPGNSEREEHGKPEHADKDK